MVCLTFIVLVFPQLSGAVVLCWKEQQKIQCIQILSTPVQLKTVSVKLFSSFLFFLNRVCHCSHHTEQRRVIDLVKYSTQGTSRWDVSVECQRGFVVSLIAVSLHQQPYTILKTTCLFFSTGMSDDKQKALKIFLLLSKLTYPCRYYLILLQRFVFLDGLQRNRE